MTVVQPPAAERMPMAGSQPDLKAIALFIEAAQKDCAGSAPAAPPQPDSAANPESKAEEGAPAAQ
jgi:hypothetical protein